MKHKIILNVSKATAQILPSNLFFLELTTSLLIYGILYTFSVCKLFKLNPSNMFVLFKELLFLDVYYIDL